MRRFASTIFWTFAVLFFYWLIGYYFLPPGKAGLGAVSWWSLGLPVVGAAVIILGAAGRLPGTGRRSPREPRE